MRFKGKKRGGTKGFKKILAPQVLNAVIQGRITSVVSQQTPTDVQLYNGATAQTPFLCGSVDLTDCQSILGATEPTAATQGAAGNGTAATRRMWLQSIDCKITFKNQTNTPVDVVLYDCVARRDGQSTSSPYFAWTGGLVDENVAVVPGNANALSARFPGAKPFQSQLFCQEYNVRRTAKFVLGAGSNHIHTISIKPKYLISNERVRNFNFFKGLSTSLLAVVKGGVVQDTTTPFNVAYGSAEVDYISEVQYKFSAFERSRTAYTQYSSLPATLTVQGTILEDTDVVAAVATV